MFKNHLMTGVALFVIGSLVLTTGKIIKPLIDRHNEEAAIADSSDISKFDGKITIGIDNWAGYFYLCSNHMKNLMKDEKYLIKCVDDGGNYKQRMVDLSGGKIDLAVATVDSYIINADPVNYPGSIISVIDESHGGDAIIANKDIVSNIDMLKTKSVRIAFTEKSPSHHLLRALATHFGISLDKQILVPTNSSKDAANLLETGQVDIAVLWEPDVTTVLSKHQNYVNLYNTKTVDNLIVDILVANRDYIIKHPKLVTLLLTKYYETLNYYGIKSNNAEFINDFKKFVGVENVDPIIQGIKWTTLVDNAALWLGIRRDNSYGQEQLVDAIAATMNILIAQKLFTTNPVSDPYKIINSSFIDKMTVSAPIAVSDNKKFDKVNWDSLSPIGSLQIAPISFKRGTADLELAGKQELDKMMVIIKQYPNVYILIKGHTSLLGDVNMNNDLSLRRASTVMKYLKEVHGIDINRMKPLGLGGSVPLKRLDNEGDRVYYGRLPRVEVELLQ